MSFLKYLKEDLGNQFKDLQQRNNNMSFKDFIKKQLSCNLKEGWKEDQEDRDGFKYSVSQFEKGFSNVKSPEELLNKLIESVKQYPSMERIRLGHASLRAYPRVHAALNILIKNFGLDKESFSEPEQFTHEFETETNEPIESETEY